MSQNLKTIHQFCKYRKSVFDRIRKDVVFYISDLLSGEFKRTISATVTGVIPFCATSSLPCIPPGRARI